MALKRNSRSSNDKKSITDTGSSSYTESTSNSTNYNTSNVIGDKEDKNVKQKEKYYYSWW
ncbi:MAG: hypothetical protein ACK5JH_01130 [Anaerocolumna sp.]